MNFEGVFPILPTPFNDDESVDHGSFARIVSFMRTIGTDGITILGVLGEANRLTDSERTSLIDTAVQAADGSLPIIVGTSHSGTRATQSLGQAAAAAGADAIMVTPHKEAVHSEARIYDHFAAVCEGSTLPVVLQDHPGSTDVHMSPDLVLRLVDDLERIECIKQEALPSPARVSSLRSQLNRQVPILTGLGALYGAFELDAGADGFMTGFAFPEVLQAMVSCDDSERLWQLYERFLPLIVYEGQPGVAVRKHLFKLRGLMTSDTVRRPAQGISPIAREQLVTLLHRLFGESDISLPLEL